MTSRVTISIDSDLKKRLQLLAKNRQRTISGLITELITQEAKKEKIKTSKKGLGTYLSNLTLSEIPEYRSDQEMLANLKEDKHLRNA
jgi:metal-responsive CopG/Arc/MetJ family transcriptional regulator